MVRFIVENFQIIRKNQRLGQRALKYQARTISKKNNKKS